MTLEPSPQNTKICPTCGTRLAESAARCQVCGADLSVADDKAHKQVQAGRIPEITLSLPVALGLLALFLLVGAALVFVVMRATGLGAVAPAGGVATATLTQTPTVSPTATDVFTSTPEPTATTQPPFEYTIASGDSCISIAVSFGVSVQSLIILNNLPASCTSLVVGQKIKVPYPTPTPPPVATATLEASQATLQACDKVIYTVQSNDTLSSISANYLVPQDAIRAYNRLPTDVVYLGMNLIIPLCERAATPGPSPTPTIPPPYSAPNLLQPPDGFSFTLANDTITLQWATIGTLRENEAYMVVVEDVTDGQGTRIAEYVTDTKFLVPASFRPRDNLPHIFRWWVVAVRQSGSDDQGQPIWVTAGAESAPRVFSWQGVASAATPTP